MEHWPEGREFETGIGGAASGIANRRLCREFKVETPVFKVDEKAVPSRNLIEQR
jgi:hypothetical protein